jgi:hypothetical protein
MCTKPMQVNVQAGLYVAQHMLACIYCVACTSKAAHLLAIARFGTQANVEISWQQNLYRHFKCRRRLLRRLDGARQQRMLESFVAVLP